MRKPRKKRLAFHTGLLACDYRQYPRPPYKGNGWHLELASPPTELPMGSMGLAGKTYPAKEVLVLAETEATAQRAADLVHAARLVLDGSNLLSHIHPGEHAPIYAAGTTNASELAIDESEFLSQKRVMTLHVPLACLIAARASARLQYVYALAKLRLSLETFSLPFVELDPRHHENVPKSPLPEDHVRCAFAIVAAWSCIEELGFEIRASEKNPSKLSGGKWNPVVKDELEARLRRGRINLKELFHWNLRGPRTRLEMKRVPSIIKAAPWARRHVRDGQMEVIDAIHYVSFLRSWVAAHRADKRLIRVLSVYDVANAQSLARRLFLEKTGFWRYWGNDRKGAKAATAAK